VIPTKSSASLDGTSSSGDGSSAISLPRDANYSAVFEQTLRSGASTTSGGASSSSQYADFLATRDLK
jgi:hypothetical protein